MNSEVEQLRTVSIQEPGALRRSLFFIFSFLRLKPIFNPNVLLMQEFQGLRSTLQQQLEATANLASVVSIIIILPSIHSFLDGVFLDVFFFGWFLNTSTLHFTLFGDPSHLGGRCRRGIKRLRIVIGTIDDVYLKKSTTESL